jgi:hypothetical protein
MGVYDKLLSFSETFIMGPFHIYLRFRFLEVFP